eukprot:c6053_g1_i2 orf=393-1016(-)
MASTSLASGFHGLGTRSVLSNQNEGLCCMRRNFQIARLARDLPLQQYGCHLNGGSWKKSSLPKALSDGDQPSDGDDEGDDSSSDSFYQANQESFRKKLENIIGDDDASFCGKDLAMLIRNKYGRSYDVQLIKKEFMGRQLLAMNVMWKYREQRSFPLTEEEYLLHLDDVANNLRCWGAVSYVRNSLAKTKERPRIGKMMCIIQAGQS